MCDASPVCVVFVLFESRDLWNICSHGGWSSMLAPACMVSHVYLTFTAETEHKGTEHLDLAGAPPRKSHDKSPPTSSPETKKKSKGFKRFFGR